MQGGTVMFKQKLKAHSGLKYNFLLLDLRQLHQLYTTASVCRSYSMCKKRTPVGKVKLSQVMSLESAFIRTEDYTFTFKKI